ncbi:DUF222 domain-containing protein [Lentzea tibetensis]|uniref:DUF222 domain-containing protein n=2 Tax=Lentzea tibetensis TaxID=2591470 RepID=A0A563ETQ8_9PSEU|nr:DUF222 domain-containing protein [Lentzea tibetensis]
MIIFYFSLSRVNLAGPCCGNIGGMGEVGALDSIRECQRGIDYWQARMVRALAEFAQSRRRDEFAADEVAAWMKWTSGWAASQLALAEDLVTRLPETVDALQRGEIDLYKARTLNDLTKPLSDEQVREVEERVLGKAAGQTGQQMRARARRLVMKVDPQGWEERRAEKRAQRVAWFEPLEDEMAQLSAMLPAEQGTAIAHRVDVLARRAKTPGDTRTLNQRRADVVADLLLATPDGSSSVKVNLYVTVSATTLMGLDEEAAELAGYGPISASLARELAGDATWSRLLTDPVDGKLLDFGRITYKPPAALRKSIWARDKTCRFPGCMRQAQRCEIDHTTPFPEGATSVDNCGAYCKRHHRLKHESDWVVTQPSPGRFVHRSPAGKTYVTEPEPVLAGFADIPPF